MRNSYELALLTKRQVCLGGEAHQSGELFLETQSLFGCEPQERIEPPLVLDSDFTGAAVVREHFLASVNVISSDEKDSVADSLKLCIAFLFDVFGVGKSSDAMVVNEEFHGSPASDRRIDAPDGVLNTFDVSGLSLLEHTRSF